VQTVPSNRGNPPAEPKTPDGPIIQESDGKKAPVRTYEDLLENRHDEDLFDYYATAQLTRVTLPHSAHLGPIRATSTSPPAAGKSASPESFPASILLLTASICWSAAFSILIRTSCRKVNSRAKWRYGALPASWNTKLPAFRWKSMSRLRAFR
jgi:hypothetical protein